jgi:hypothetical protein
MKKIKTSKQMLAVYGPPKESEREYMWREHGLRPRRKRKKKVCCAPCSELTRVAHSHVNGRIRKLKLTKCRGKR